MESVIRHRITLSNELAQERPARRNVGVGGLVGGGIVEGTTRPAEGVQRALFGLEGGNPSNSRR
jgi:hypothetical protein